MDRRGGPLQRAPAPGGGTLNAGPGLLPPRPFLGLVLRRAALIWVGGRAALAFLGWIILLDPSRLSRLVVVGLIAMVSVVTWLDLRRRGEDVLMANLGTGPGSILLAASAVPLIGEAALAVLLRTLLGP